MSNNLLQEAKDTDLIIGKELWFIGYGEAPVKSVIICSVDLEQHYASVGFDYKNNTQCLGDLGIEGYKYDQRPCKLYLTKEAAEQALPVVEEWMNNRDFLFDYKK